MRYTDKQYAQLLTDALADKPQSEVRAVVEAFLSLLQEHGALARGERIIAAFGSAWNKRQGIVEAHVQSAQALPESILHELSERIKTDTGAKEVVLTSESYPSLIGGVVVRFADKVLDASVKGQLVKLRETLTRSL